MNENLFAKKRFCPICKHDKCSNFLREKIDLKKLNSFSFASRKNPEFMRMNLVKCNDCSLIYANKPLKNSFIRKLYTSSDFDSSQSAMQASYAYFYHLKKYIRNLNKQSEILDVGTGEGSFMYLLKQYGLKRVYGIEPSVKAIARSSSSIKQNIKKGFFSKKLINNKKFDLITFFMTLEHVQDPDKIISDFYDSLKKNGKLVVVVHNYSSFLNKIFGSKSPIIDIEHLQLFNKKSVSRLLKKNNFNNIELHNLKNYYSLNYLIRLLPIHYLLKNFIFFILKMILIGNLKIPLYLGNLIVIADKK